MGKPTICLAENKDADQLRSNCEADQRLCFRYSDSTVSLLLKAEISRFKLFSVNVQVDLCRTWSETTLLVFPRGGLFEITILTLFQLRCHTFMGNCRTMSRIYVCLKVFTSVVKYIENS